MTITDLGEYESSGPPSEDLGRTPPQDVAAEQSVLGGMMLSKDAIADVIEVLRGTDFYRPAHELVYEAVLDLYGRGEPADAVTVADELTKRGQLGRIGGAAYLHTLISSVPTAANAGYYARIVHERAVLRRLVEAGTRIVQLGYAPAGGDVDEIVNTAQAEVYAVTERRASEDYLPLSEIIEGTIDEIEASSHRGDGMIGVPTGFADLDRLTNGLHPGQMIVIAARPAIGKCLAASSLLDDAYTGRRMTVAEFVRRGQAGERLGVHTLDERWRLQVVDPSDFVDNGVREVHRLHLASGRQVTATANHPLRTLTGWAPLEELRPGDRVAVPRRLPAWRRRRRSPYSDAVVALTGLVLGGGRLVSDDVVRVEAPNDTVAEDVRGWAEELGLAVEQAPGGRLLLRPGETGRNELAVALHAFGLVGLTSRGLRVPKGFFTLPDRQTLLLLQRVFAATGWARVRRSSRGGARTRVEVGVVAGSERLARDLVHLLSRFAVVAELEGPGQGARAASGWRVTLRDPEQVARFCRDVAALGLEEDCAAVRAACRDLSSTETLPDGVAPLVAKAREAAGWSQLDDDPVPDAELLTRPGLAAVADRLGHAELGDLAASDVWWDEVVEVEPAGWDRVYDLTVDGTHNFVADDVVVHNSTIGLDIARSAAIKNGLSTVVFSLEMSRNEITMRLLSAEARIPLQNMRKGTMREEDWTRLARTMGQVSEAPLFIDDSPNMSLMEIRAKCRRLKQRHDLKMVIVDYLQLMTSGKRVESRQQEVSEFSRALKLLAKELEVPVIAISQLNRGPEQRTDKKPAMSDLRESGCLTADTRVLRADTGAETTMGELYAAGATDVPVWALDDSLRYVRRHLTHVFPTGRKPVFRLRLASGKEVRATANHPFLTYDGWTPLGELSVGSRVGVPRHVPAPERVAVWDDDEVAALAERCSSGSLPTELFHLPKRQIALFLGTVWAAGGSVAVDGDGCRGRIAFASPRRELVDGLSRLLLRFGISTQLDSAEPDRYLLEVAGADDQRRFLQEIGVCGGDGEAAARLLPLVRAATARVVEPTEPAHVWDQVRDVLIGQRNTQSARLASASSQRLGQIAAVLDDAELDIAAVNDLIWDRIVAVEQDGEEDVFDATVLGTHNFIANGIAVHNSIEQDADMVILLHREDAYERESPRAGEADLIVAKHRNGPTDTIVVAFQGHYSRFVDMAQG